MSTEHQHTPPRISSTASGIPRRAEWKSPDLCRRWEERLEHQGSGEPPPDDCGGGVGSGPVQGHLSLRCQPMGPVQDADESGYYDISASAPASPSLLRGAVRERWSPTSTSSRASNARCCEYSRELDQGVQGACRLIRWVSSRGARGYGRAVLIARPASRRATQDRETKACRLTGFAGARPERNWKRSAGSTGPSLRKQNRAGNRSRINARKITTTSAGVDARHRSQVSQREVHRHNVYTALLQTEAKHVVNPPEIGSAGSTRSPGGRRRAFRPVQERPRRAKRYSDEDLQALKEL